MGCWVRCGPTAMTPSCRERERTLSASAARTTAKAQEAAKPRPRRGPLPNPAEQILHLLQGFKARSWPFEQAWDKAWRSVKWPDKRETRDEWKAVIREGRSIWQSCYLDEGTPIDVPRLIEALSRETDRQDALAA